VKNSYAVRYFFCRIFGRRKRISGNQEIRRQVIGRTGNQVAVMGTGTAAYFFSAASTVNKKIYGKGCVVPIIRPKIRNYAKKFIS